jgi:hypothetical protein
MVGACSSDGVGRGVYRGLVWKHEGKRPLGRPRHRWENNIKMDSQEVECGVWTRLSWLSKRQVAGTGERGNEPSGFIKLTSCKPVSFLRRAVLHGVSK